MVLVGGALCLGGAPRAAAQCTRAEDANAARKTVTKAVKCNDKRLKAGPTASSNLVPPPGCSGSITIDAVALAYGPNNPPPAAAKTPSTQRRCQKQIGKGGPIS